MGSIEAGSLDVDGIEVAFRRVVGTGPPAVFVHGNPTSGAQYAPFLERMHGPGIAFDLPGFGDSARPGPECFDYSMHGQAAFLERIWDAAGIAELSLVADDWGALALITAQRRPERIKRLVLMNAVPLLPGYRWHRTARIWRTPILGEASRFVFRKPVARLALREARGDWSAMPEEFIELMFRGIDAGMWRAMLALYRSASPSELEAAGRNLGRITAPALLIWSQKDRYIGRNNGRLYAERLSNSELVELPEAGHWAWIDDPTVVDRVIAFLEG